MNFVFHPEATEEFYKAIDYYEETKPGLGFDFAIEVYSAIKRATAFPYAWPVIEDGIRRALVTGFLSVCCTQLKRKDYLSLPKCIFIVNRVTGSTGNENKY